MDSHLFKYGCGRAIFLQDQKSGLFSGNTLKRLSFLLVFLPNLVDQKGFADWFTEGQRPQAAQLNAVENGGSAQLKPACQFVRLHVGGAFDGLRHQGFVLASNNRNK